MQTDEVDFEFTTNTLNTPSLMTPNIVLHAPPFKLTYKPINTDNSTNSEQSSNPSSITTTASNASPIASSADVKVSKIEDELKQSFGDTRKPTPSPFQKISSTNIFNLDKPPNTIIAEDGSTVEIPSTADVVKEIEAMTNTKTSISDTNERETATLNSDNIRYDSPPTVNTGVIVSPKKHFLIRSQSHTEPASPNQYNNNNHSQSQKSNHDNSISNTHNGLDDENSMDNPVNHHFTRLTDLSTVTHVNDMNNQHFKSTMDNGNEQHLNLQLRSDQNGISHTIVKQQPVINNTINHHKRTVQQMHMSNNVSPITKVNPVMIPQASLNEVTSTDLGPNIKRQRTAPMPMNSSVVSFRPSVPSLSATQIFPTTTTTNGSNVNVGSDDQRKRQIRDSNREAARRCRERRRQYIEQLEGNLEQYKSQIKQLAEKTARVERENTQLRAILSETKMLHPSARLSINESHDDYANVMAANAMDLNSDSNHHNDGGTLQRKYINRNNL